jgi:hypothetical protein
VNWQRLVALNIALFDMRLAIDEAKDQLGLLLEEYATRCDHPKSQRRDYGTTMMQCAKCGSVLSPDSWEFLDKSKPKGETVA